jgi:hypothetical protein
MYKETSEKTEGKETSEKTEGPIKKLTFHRNWQHWVHKTQDEDKQN